jgi:hypothetical protein
VAPCLRLVQEKRFSTSEVLSHPWLKQTLLPDQQRAWEELQSEQQAVTQNIALKSDMYKVGHTSCVHGKSRGGGGGRGW